MRALCRLHGVGETQCALAYEPVNNRSLVVRVHGGDVVFHRHKRGRRPRIRGRLGASAIGSVTFLAIVATACSAASTPSVASLPGRHPAATSASQPSSSESDQDLVNFARCLRRHGAAEPDPVHIPGHSGLSVQIPPSGPTTNAALNVCNHYLAPVMRMKQAHARQELASWLPGLTHYAQCMRSHDIAMLDPNSDGSLSLGNVPGITSDFGRYSPQFRSADAACRHFLPAAVHDDGTGP